MIWHALIPPQFHHNCVAAHVVRWRSTAVGVLQNPLRHTAYGALWRLTVGFGSDSLKIMVSPVRIRVPPLTKTGVLQGKRHKLKPRTLRPTTKSPHPALCEAPEAGSDVPLPPPRFPSPFSEYGGVKLWPPSRHRYISEDLLGGGGTLAPLFTP
jgi:hypothetical protein